MTENLRETKLEELVETSRRQYRTIDQMVTALIRKAIVSGVFAPGDRLPQDYLAEVFEVSRMPIRAALRQLESEGLVQLHAHRGATVLSLSTEDITELYELRALVEAHALRKTLAKITPEAIERLEALAKPLDADSSDDEWLDARTRFYKELYSIGNAPRVVANIMQLRTEVGRYLHGLSSPRSTSHQVLLAHLKSGDVTGAVEWLGDHFDRVSRQLSGQLA